MKKLIALLVIVGVGVGLWRLWPADEPWPITNETGPDGAWVALGDSLTSGYGVGDESCYIGLLSRRLGVEIVNRGVNGDTTADGLARLERDVLTYAPRLVIVGLGGNDMLRRVDPEETFANLQTIIERTHKRGAMVVLLGYNFPLKSSYARRYRELAEQHGCVFLPDTLGGVFGRRELMSDSVHPNAAGHEKIADKLEPILRRYVK